MAARLLITGGAGFIGVNVIDALSRAGGYDITVLDNESTGSFDHVAPFGVRIVRSDIRDAGVVRRALDGIETVLHLAADTRVIDSIADPAKNFDVNVVGTFTLLRCAREAGVRTFVNASTGGAILGEAPSPVHEDLPPQPLSPYGASKLAAEGYCSAFAGAYGLRCISLRFSNVYGPRSFHKGSVVAHYFRQLIDGRELVVYGDGTQTRDFLFVSDLACGIRQAIEREVTGVFQLGSGRPTTINALIEVIRTTLDGDADVRVRYSDARPGEVHTTWCDITKARRAFGFEPSTPLASGLKATWQWFRATHARQLA